MARRKRKRNRAYLRPANDRIAELTRRIEVLLRADRDWLAISAIRQHTAEVAQDAATREATPVDEWPINDEELGLERHLVAILEDTPFITIGRCDAASDDELLQIEMLGPAYLTDLREAIARVIARQPIFD